MLVLSLLVLSAAPLKVAVPDFSVISVDKESASFFMDRFANRLRAKGLAVTTPAEIEAVLGLERQKALLGCSESSSSCQAEIAAALGADAIIRGRIARFGQRFELSLTLIDPANAAVLASLSPSASDEGKVIDTLETSADELASKLYAVKRQGEAPPVAQVHETPSQGSSRWVAAIPLAVGVGAGIFGAVELATSYDTAKRIETAPNYESVGSQAKLERALGISMLCVGAAGITTAAILFFTGAKPAATPIAVITPHGAVIGVEGRLP
jgi:hypothetical protein